MAGLRFRLREATGGLHAEVDTLFGRYDLIDPNGYRAFLLAHAAALLPLETLIADSGIWPAFRPRSLDLHADLQSLGAVPGPALPIPEAVSPGQAWGLLYVIEGSRLGGRLLAGRIGPGLSRRYFEAAPAEGGWRGFQTALDAAAEDGGPTFEAEAEAGAVEGFSVFALAAREGLAAGTAAPDRSAARVAGEGRRALGE